MRYPLDLKPVLAEIGGQNSLGYSTWREVVYYDDVSEQWRAYSGSRTFDNGERVLSWIYADDVVLPNHFS